MLLLSQWLNRSSSLILEAILCSKGSCWIMWRRIASIELAASLPPTSNLLDVTIQHSNHIYKLQMAPSWYSEYLLFSTGCHHSTTVHHFIFLAHIPNSEVYDCLVSSSGKQIDTNWRRKEGPNEAICAKGGSSWHVSSVSNGETVSTLSENRTWPVSNVSPQLQDVHHVWFYLRWEVSLFNDCKISIQ